MKYKLLPLLLLLPTVIPADPPTMVPVSYTHLTLPTNREV